MWMWEKYIVANDNWIIYVFFILVRNMMVANTGNFAKSMFARLRLTDVYVSSNGTIPS